MAKSNLPKVKRGKGILTVEQYRQHLDFAKAEARRDRAVGELEKLVYAVEGTNILTEDGQQVLMNSAIDSSRLAALKLLIDSNQYVVNKFIPNAREQVDVTSGGESLAPRQTMTPLELANKLSYLARMSKKTEEVEEWLT